MAEPDRSPQVANIQFKGGGWATVTTGDGQTLNLQTVGPGHLRKTHSPLTNAGGIPAQGPSAETAYVAHLVVRNDQAQVSKFPHAGLRRPLGKVKQEQSS